MNEELCHRNMAFSLYQAGEMPLVQFGEPSVDALGDDLWRVRVPIANDRLTPTILAKAQRNNVVRPDLLRLEGAGRRRSWRRAGCGIGSAAAPPT